MRYRLFALLLAVFCMPAAAFPKYFGYFNNNTTPDLSFQPENYAHTNITHVFTGPDGYDWDQTILKEVALAKAYGNKAIITVESHLFVTTPNAYTADPQAGDHFNTLVTKLIAGGYLVPNDPEASTVVAFYPVDEPEYNKGMADVGGAPHPALANAVQIIKNHPSTRNFPVAVVVSHNYTPVIQGMRLFDWVGVNNYHTSDDNYRIFFATFSSYLRPEQRTIWMPQAGIGGDLDSTPHTPTTTYEHALRDPKVIMLMPFLWGTLPGSDMVGVRGLPALRNAYPPIGYQIKYGLYGHYISGQVYGSMVAGQWYNLVLWFRNISEKTWRAGTNINLGSQNPTDNVVWGTNRVALPHDVAPGTDVAFNFWVPAPGSPGTYPMQWQMVADGMSWFGGPTPAWSIGVVAPASGSIWANPSPCTIPWGGSNCTSTLSWNSNRGDAEVWVSGIDGSNPMLLARAQNGSVAVPWITTDGFRFALKSGGAAITHVDVYGVQGGEPPPEEPPPCPTPHCVEP